MFLGLRTIIYPAPDLEKAKAWYSGILGIEPYFDEPFFVGYNVGGYELGLDPNADPSAGPVTLWGVPDIDTALARLRAAGAGEGSGPDDVGDGIRVATVIDPMGATVGIIENPHFQLAPPPADPAGGPGR